jgi:hypothetical protein
MHDFAATRTHTILLNLPLTLAPANLFSIPPVPLIHFDRHLPSEFIIFPRLLGAKINDDAAEHDTRNDSNDLSRHAINQEPVRFIDPEPSLIFHTANAWDEVEISSSGRTTAVHMLGCRFRSAKLVYAAGAVEVPIPEAIVGAEDVVRLWYYRFALPSHPPISASSSDDTKKGQARNVNSNTGVITHQFPLTAIPFEFPSTHPELGMQEARYVYGCTMRSGSFDERLGGAAKVDCLVKIDVLTLAKRGRERGEGKTNEPVDKRESGEILHRQERRQSRASRGGDEREGDVVQIFALPQGWYAQEPRFVPRSNAVSEDDGYLLTYGMSLILLHIAARLADQSRPEPTRIGADHAVYDESNLLPDGTPASGLDAGSELWVIDARRMVEGMVAVVCRIRLPQRVPYGYVFCRSSVSCIFPPFHRDSTLRDTIVHHDLKTDLHRLHGTYLPPSQIAAQRKLPTPLPVQPKLQDKLHRSRIQHFVSLLFDRPSARDMSRIERWVLAVLWPAAVGALCLAMVDILGGLQWREDWWQGSLLAGSSSLGLDGSYGRYVHGMDGVSGARDDEGLLGDVVAEGTANAARWGPQVAGVLAALLTALFRNGVLSVRYPRSAVPTSVSPTDSVAGSEGDGGSETVSDVSSEGEAEEVLS